MFTWWYTTLYIEICKLRSVWTKKERCWIFAFQYCKVKRNRWLNSNSTAYQGCGAVRSLRCLGGIGFLTTLRVGVGFFCSTWLIFYITLLSWEFLLKWYNFLWNFCWNREFLLCTTISIESVATKFLQPNYIHFMLRSRSPKFWKGLSRTFCLRLHNPVAYVFWFYIDCGIVFGKDGDSVPDCFDAVDELKKYMKGTCHQGEFFLWTIRIVKWQVAFCLSHIFCSETFESKCSGYSVQFDRSSLNFVMQSRFCLTDAEPSPEVT